mmetsp:Transcript_9601/g.27499  ORF Transcript_9601/g.27499 Transcript_9601/m.27499 type:complete len:284 (+) Transcript_9601:1424-2275(+)
MQPEPRVRIGVSVGIDQHCRLVHLPRQLGEGRRVKLQQAFPVAGRLGVLESDPCCVRQAGQPLLYDCPALHGGFKGGRGVLCVLQEMVELLDGATHRCPIAALPSQLLPGLGKVLCHGSQPGLHGGLLPRKDIGPLLELKHLRVHLLHVLNRYSVTHIRHFALQRGLVFLKGHDLGLEKGHLLMQALALTLAGCLEVLQLLVELCCLQELALCLLPPPLRVVDNLFQGVHRLLQAGKHALVGHGLLHSQGLPGIQQLLPGLHQAAGKPLRLIAKRPHLRSQLL